MRLVRESVIMIGLLALLLCGSCSVSGLEDSTGSKMGNEKPSNTFEVGSLAALNAVKVQTYQNGPVFQNQIYEKILLVNTGSTSVNLSTLKVRYYFVYQGNTSYNFACDYTPVGSANTTYTFVPLNPAKPMAECFEEIGFKAAAGSLASGASIELQCRIWKSDWSNIDNSLNYSYNPSSAYTDWKKVTIYQDGSLIWGWEPGAVASSSSFITSQSRSSIMSSSSIKLSSSASSSSISSKSSDIYANWVTPQFVAKCDGDGAGTVIKIDPNLNRISFNKSEQLYAGTTMKVVNNYYQPDMTTYPTTGYGYHSEVFRSHGIYTREVNYFGLAFYIGTNEYGHCSPNSQRVITQLYDQYPDDATPTKERWQCLFFLQVNQASGGNMAISIRQYKDNAGGSYPDVTVCTMPTNQMLRKWHTVTVEAAFFNANQGFLNVWVDGIKYPIYTNVTMSWHSRHVPLVWNHGVYNWYKTSNPPPAADSTNVVYMDREFLVRGMNASIKTQADQWVMGH